VEANSASSYSKNKKQFPVRINEASTYRRNHHSRLALYIFFCCSCHAFVRTDSVIKNIFIKGASFQKGVAMLSVESKRRKQLSHHNASTHTINRLTSPFKKKGFALFICYALMIFCFFAVVFLIYRYRVMFDFENLNLFDILKL